MKTLLCERKYEQHAYTRVRPDHTVISVFLFYNKGGYFVFFVPCIVIQLCNVNQKMHTFQIIVLIQFLMTSTSFEQYVLIIRKIICTCRFYGMLFMHLRKQSARLNVVLDARFCCYFLSIVVCTGVSSLEIFFTSIFSTFFSIPKHLPVSFILSIMHCITVVFLVKTTRNSTYFARRSNCTDNNIELLYKAN